jgi:hypothetical protein
LFAFTAVYTRRAQLEHLTSLIPEAVPEAAPEDGDSPQVPLPPD